MFIVKVVEDDAELIAHQRARYEVYVKEKGWVPRAQAPNGREVDEFDSQSIHIVALDLTGEPAGAIRIIRRNNDRKSLPLPVEAEPFGIPILDDRSVMEVSRLAVPPAYRGNHLVMLGLIRVVVEVAVEQAMEDCYALVEKPLYTSLRYVGFNFKPLSPPKSYFGGHVMPVFGLVADLVQGVENGRRGHFFQRPFDGYIDDKVVAA